MPGYDFTKDPSGFVLLSDYVPHAVQEIRYFSTYNFIGERIDGYEEPCAIITAEAARALKSVSNDKSVTYQYYFDHIKPKPAPAPAEKKGFVCKICGYVYEGDTLPEDFVCPLCKHGAEDFEPLK